MFCERVAVGLPREKVASETGSTPLIKSFERPRASHPATHWDRRRTSRTDPEPLLGLLHDLENPPIVVDGRNKKALRRARSFVITSENCDHRSPGSRMSSGEPVQDPASAVGSRHDVADHRRDHAPGHLVDGAAGLGVSGDSLYVARASAQPVAHRRAFEAINPARSPSSTSCDRYAMSSAKLAT